MRFKYGIGQCLYLLWMASSFFLTTLITVNLRSFLIMPELESPIEDHYRDIHYESSNIALDFGNCTAYPAINIPLYRVFHKMWALKTGLLYIFQQKFYSTPYLKI